MVVRGWLGWHLARAAGTAAGRKRTQVRQELLGRGTPREPLGMGAGGRAVDAQRFQAGFTQIFMHHAGRLSPSTSIGP